eukprot:710282-Heterocapsa_arctica.AAC.1
MEGSQRLEGRGVPCRGRGPARKFCGRSCRGQRSPAGARACRPKVRDLLPVARLRGCFCCRRAK